MESAARSTYPSLTLPSSPRVRECHQRARPNLQQFYCRSLRKTPQFFEQHCGLTIRFQYVNCCVYEIATQTCRRWRFQPWIALQQMDHWPSMKWKERKEILIRKYRLIKPCWSQAEPALTLKLPLLQLSSFGLCLRENWTNVFTW